MTPSGSGAENCSKLTPSFKGNNYLMTLAKWIPFLLTMIAHGGPLNPPDANVVIIFPWLSLRGPVARRLRAERVRAMAVVAVLATKR